MTNSITLSSVKAIAELSLNGDIFIRFIKNSIGAKSSDIITLTSLHKESPNIGLILSINVDKEEDKKTFDYAKQIQDSLTSKGYKVYNGTVNHIDAAYKVQLSTIIDANNPPYLKSMPLQYEPNLKLCTCNSAYLEDSNKASAKKGSKKEDTPKE